MVVVRVWLTYIQLNLWRKYRILLWLSFTLMLGCVMEFYQSPLTGYNFIVMVMAHMFMNLIIALYFFEVMCYTWQAQNVWDYLVLWHWNKKLLFILRNMELGEEHKSVIVEDICCWSNDWKIFLGKDTELWKDCLPHSKQCNWRQEKLPLWKSHRGWCDQFIHHVILVNALGHHLTVSIFLVYIW